MIEETLNENIENIKNIDIGDVICNKCNGSGKNENFQYGNQRSENLNISNIPSHTHTISGYYNNRCTKCYGFGKLTWIENILGKDDPNPPVYGHTGYAGSSGLSGATGYGYGGSTGYAGSSGLSGVTGYGGSTGLPFAGLTHNHTGSGGFPHNHIYNTNALNQYLQPPQLINKDSYEIDKISLLKNKKISIKKIKNSLINFLKK